MLPFSISAEATQEEFLAKATEYLANLRVAKNSDYGAAYERHGSFGLVVRLWDKYSRIEHLLKKGQANRAVISETVADTVLDLINYGLLLLWALHKETLPAKPAPVVAKANPLWETTVQSLEEKIISGSK